MIRLVVVDDEYLVCSYLTAILDADPEMSVVAQVHDGAAAVEAAVTCRPDVMLMDVRMPGVDGVTATRRITRLGLPVRVIALTGLDLDSSIDDMLSAGAAGFLGKDTPPSDLLDLVRVAARGHAVLSAPALARFARQAGASAETDALLAGLTARESDVLDHLVLGATNARIAGLLGVSEATVKGHVSRILDKLGCSNRSQAALLALPAHRRRGSPHRETPRR